jgi:hypothetical protein
VVRSPAAAALAAIWLAGSAGLVALFPHERTVSEAASAAADPVPVETLTPEQLVELHAWLDRQPRVPEAMPTQDAKVLLMKFNDYQCPTCRQTWILYKDIIEKYEKQYPRVFRFETRDFPLEPECGAGGQHTAACEEAVAVRLAREKNLDKQMEATLFERQSFSLTRDDVKAALKEVAHIDSAEYDKRYEKSRLLPDGPERNRLYREMARIMETDTVWLLTDSRYRNVLMQPRVKGFRKHPVLHAEWLYIDLE